MSEACCRVSVNAPPEYLADPSLMPDVGDIVDETGAGSVESAPEVNKSSMIPYDELAQETLHRIRALLPGAEALTLRVGRCREYVIRGEAGGDVQKVDLGAFPLADARVGWYTREDSNL